MQVSPFILLRIWLPTLASVFRLGRTTARFQFWADDHLPAARLRFCAAALIVCAAHLPGHPPVGGYGRNALVAQRWINRSFGAENCGFWRRGSDLDITPKELYGQIAGGVSIISPVPNEAGHFPVNLIQKRGQGSRIPHILSGQIRADDLACGEV